MVGFEGPAERGECYFQRGATGNGTEMLLVVIRSYLRIGTLQSHRTTHKAFAEIRMRVSGRRRISKAVCTVFAVAENLDSLLQALVFSQLAKNPLNTQIPIRFSFGGTERGRNLSENAC